MDLMLFYAVLIGLVEGITEFLPVSSTGHIIIASDLLNFQAPAGKVFEISIQLGAILAVCWLFRAKIISVICGLPREKPAQKFALNIFLAFLPAGVLGLAFHHAITEHLFNVTVVATMFVVGGFAILAIEKWKPAPRVFSTDDITPKTALAIGFCQAIAMIPGVSRSGSTIMGSLLLGIERKQAAEFSFYLAIPTMFAATIYDVYKNWADLSSNGLELIAVGFVVAFFSALVVVRWFMNFISRHGFQPFAWYRIVVGSAILLVLYLR